MSDLWTLGVPAAEKVPRTVAVYWGLAILLRVAGKRNLAQLNSFGLVVVLLLSNIVQNAIIGLDDSLIGGLLDAVVPLSANAAVVRVVNRSEAAVAVEGEDSRWQGWAVHRQGATPGGRAARPEPQWCRRRRGHAEPGGSIVVRLKPQHMSATRADMATIETRLATRGQSLSAFLPDARLEVAQEH